MTRTFATGISGGAGNSTFSLPRNADNSARNRRCSSHVSSTKSPPSRKSLKPRRQVVLGGPFRCLSQRFRSPVVRSDARIYSSRNRYDFRVTGGTVISGVRPGRLCAIRSPSRMRWRARAPYLQKAVGRSIKPIRHPPWEKPQGTEIAGNPKMLNGEQFETIRFAWRGSFFAVQCIVDGPCRIRIVGSTTRSKFVKAASMFLRSRVSFQLEVT